jgi:hypothetical protein
VPDDLPVPNCAQCGRPIFDRGWIHRVVHAIQVGDAAERDAKREARSMRIVHEECWPAYAEAHNIDAD